MSVGEPVIDPEGVALAGLAARRVGHYVRERWHLDQVLGVGGTAAVYAATHRNGKRVALKMLHPELSANPEMRQRFVDEGYLANRVKHPGAVSVIDDDTTEQGEVFLVMDLLDGENLERHVAKTGPFAPERVLAVADALLDVLAAAHDEGIVHRDIKPENVFITREGDVKLLDFGIARMTALGRTHTTKSGSPLGTPGFMPPEQARGRWDELDGRTDLWAVGATMFVLLSGRHVHEADTFNEELLSAMTIPAPSLAGLAPHLPMAVIELVDKALAFDREARWPSARDMQNAVRRVATLLASEPDSPRKKGAAAFAPASPTLVTPSLAPATASMRPARPRARQRFLLVALGAAASVLALGVTRELAQRRPVRIAISAPEMAKPALQRAAAAESYDSPIAPVAAVSSPITMQVAVPPAVVQSRPAPSTAKHNAEKARPRATTGSSDDARTVVAEPGVTATSPPQPVATPLAVDPLDRRR